MHFLLPEEKFRAFLTAGGEILCIFTVRGEILRISKRRRQNFVHFLLPEAKNLYILSLETPFWQSGAPLTRGQPEGPGP